MTIFLNRQNEEKVCNARIKKEFKDTSSNRKIIMTTATNSSTLNLINNGLIINIFNKEKMQHQRYSILIRTYGCLYTAFNLWNERENT